MSVIEKILAGSGFLIAIYLVLSHGQADVQVGGALSNAFNTGVKSLQGR